MSGSLQGTFSAPHTHSSSSNGSLYPYPPLSPYPDVIINPLLTSTLPFLTWPALALDSLTSLFQTGWFISVSNLENTMNKFNPVEISQLIGLESYLSQLEIKIPGHTPACRRRHDAFNAWCIPARQCWRRRRLHHPWSQYYHFLLYYYSVTTLCKHWASLTRLEVLGDTVVSFTWFCPRLILSLLRQ